MFIVNELGDGDSGLGAAEVDYYFGNPGDTPFTGDFNADGTDTVGLYRVSNGSMYFRNSHTQGNADNEFFYGNPGDRFVGGDWTGDGTDSPGVFRPSQATFYLKHTNTAGNADESFAYGTGNSYPVAGQWGDLPATPTMSFTHPSDGDTVFHTEAVSASIGDENGGSIDLLVDGAKVGSGPISNGTASVDWDTTAVNDGAYTLEVVANLSSGGVARTSIDVDVANGLEGDDRVEVDFEQGVLGVDDYTFHSITAATLPEALPPRYITEVDYDEEGTPFDFLALTEHWDELDSATQQQISDYLTAWDTLQEELARQLALQFQGVEVGPAPSAIRPLAVPAGYPESHWDGCDVVLHAIGVGDLLRVACVQDTGNFEIHYELTGDHPSIAPNREHGVAEVDNVVRIGDHVTSDPTKCTNTYVGCNGIPDYIDEALASLEWARAEYVKAGYKAPPKNVVNVHNVRGRALLPIFDFWMSANIEFRPRRDQYETARHEVFHVVQYLYASTRDFSHRNAWWWAEASANWAMQKYKPTTRLGESDYHAQLPAFLGRPNRDLTLHEENGPGRLFAGTERVPHLGCCDRRSQYGAFVLAEWMEATQGGPGVILKSWEEIGQGDSRDALEAIADAAGQSLSDVIFDFRIGSYLLQHNGSDIDTEVGAWRSRLGGTNPLWGVKPLPGENSTVATSFGAARPARVDQPVVRGGDAAAPLSGLLTLEPGGAVYAEMDLPPGSGRLTVTVPSEQVARSMRYAVLPFSSSGYPNLCGHPGPYELSFADAGDGMMSAVFDYGASCRFATLVGVYTDPFRGGPSRRFDAEWTIFHESKGQLVTDSGRELWEWDGAAWSKLPSPSGATRSILDLVELDGDMVALIFEQDPAQWTVRRLIDDTRWSTIKTFGPNERPARLAVADGRLYVIVEVVPDPDHTQVWRYDGGGAWTTIFDREAWSGGMIAAEFGGKEELVWVTQVDFVGLNPTASEIWLYSETDGLRRGTFDTPDGPEAKWSPRFAIHEARQAEFGGQLLLAVFGGVLASSNGTDWVWLDGPSGHITVMESHNGSVYLSGFSSGEEGAVEQPIRVYDGTSTQPVVDPPDMAWSWFVSHDAELYMSGFRDVDGSGAVVEAGIYRWDDAVGRVSISIGSPLDGVTSGELLIRESR